MNQKGFINIALVIIAIAIVGIGGYFAFVKKSEPITQQPTPAPTQTTTTTKTPISPTPTPTHDGTADWKVYTNAQYGFQIKYPSIGKVLTDTHYGGGIQATGETQFAVKYQPQTDVNGLGEGFVIFSVMPLSSAPKQNADDLFSLRQQTFGTLKERYGTENYTVETFSIGNDKGVLYYLFTPGTSGGGSGGCSMNVEVFHGNSFFVLPPTAALIYAPEVISKDCTSYLLSNFNSNFRAVLATLKFTDTNLLKLKIDSVSPLVASTGSTITVNGSGFSIPNPYQRKAMNDIPQDATVIMQNVTGQQISVFNLLNGEKHDDNTITFQLRARVCKYRERGCGPSDNDSFYFYITPGSYLLFVQIPDTNLVSNSINITVK